MKASVMNIFVSEINFQRLLSAAGWGGHRASAGVDLQHFFFCRKGNPELSFGSEDKDEMSWAHFGSRRYRF